MGKDRCRLVGGRILKACLLFRVTARSRGYKIYTTGEVDGFEGSRLLFNRDPILLAREIAEHQRVQSGVPSQQKLEPSTQSL
jgi:hypothetical protein